MLLLLLKPAAQAQAGKKLFINCFRNPTSTVPRKTEENTTQGFNQRLTTPLNPSSFGMGSVNQTQCREGHCTIEPEPAGKT